MDARMDRALDVLAAGGSRTKAAEAAGVDRTTLWRWLRDSAVADELRRRTEELAGAARAVILDNVASAGVALADCLESDNERVRLDALKFTLSTAFRISGDLELPDKIVADALAQDAELRHRIETIRLVDDVEERDDVEEQ
jgi:transcriptional regulator with XRE-family HTH domain